MKVSIHTPEQMALVLQGVRKDLGLTQKQAGSQVGMLQKTVSLVERTPEVASVGSLFKLLSALNLELVIRSKDTSQKPRDDEDAW